MFSERSVRTVADPILFRSATPRTAGSEIPGAYDPDLQVWAIEEGGELRPIILTADDALLATETVTKVRQEADDQDISGGDLIGTPQHAHKLVELLTKTDVQQESDDQIEPGFSLESDPETVSVKGQKSIRLTRSLIELETKTCADVEHDDDGPML